MTQMTSPRHAPLPLGIWALGFTSLFMDMSSELIHALLPVFLVTTLGTSMLTLGLLEGLAEAIAAMTKVFSGVISDRIGKRKLLTVIGYGMSHSPSPFFRSPSRFTPSLQPASWIALARAFAARHATP